MSWQTMVDILHICIGYSLAYLLEFSIIMTLAEKESFVVDESPTEMLITRHVQMGRFDDVIEIILLPSVHIRTSTSQTRI
jgi:hypothetical protein